MSRMFWIALKLSIPKKGLNIMLSLTVKKLDAFKFDGVAKSDNTGSELIRSFLSRPIYDETPQLLHIVTKPHYCADPIEAASPTIIIYGWCKKEGTQRKRTHPLNLVGFRPFIPSEPMLFLLLRHHIH